MQKHRTITDWIITITLCLIGTVTALPVLAVTTPEQTLQVSYGVVVADPMTLTLIQHRGIFQLMLGVGIIVAAFYRNFRLPIAITALVTKGSFTFMVLSNDAIRNQWPAYIALFDVASIVVLCTVAILERRLTQVQVD